MAMLESFIDVRLKLFATQRNDPNMAALSQLSPWIRFGRQERSSRGLRTKAFLNQLSFPSLRLAPTAFLSSFYPTSVFLLQSGQLSAQRVALQVRRGGKNAGESVAAFIEELVVRRELTDNFCFYNEKYDKVEGQCCGATPMILPYQSSVLIFFVFGFQVLMSGPRRR